MVEPLAAGAMDPKEIERELREFLGKRFGGAVQLAGAVPVGAPQAEPDGEGPEPPPPPAAAPLPDFDLKPEQLEAYLDQYVVRQDAAKEVLATKVCTHYNRIKLFREHPGESRFSGVGHIKSNILMLGPTGVGKTYLVKLIARKIGIPFVKGDATKFSETGYVGADVEDLVRDLVREAGGDIRLAEHGIVYIDEIDKIASAASSHGPDVSRTGVQRALLKPMEETDVELRVAHDMVSQMEALQDWQRTGKREKKTVSTRNILFILSGAFTGLDEIVKRRLTRSEIGFRAAETPARRRAALVVPAPRGRRGPHRLRLRVRVRRAPAGDRGPRPALRGRPLRDPAQPELPGDPGEEGRLQGLRHRRALRGRGAAQARGAGVPAAHRRARPRRASSRRRC